MTKLKLRPAAAPRPSQPFTWEPPHPATALFPSSTEAFSPPFHPFSADLMDTYGSRPMDDWTGGTEGARGKGVVGRCKNAGCGKILLESGVEEHAKICATNMARMHSGGVQVMGLKKTNGLIAQGKKLGIKNGKRSALEGSPTPSVGDATPPPPKRIKMTHKNSLLSQGTVTEEVGEVPSTPTAGEQPIWLEDQNRYERKKEMVARLAGEKREQVRPGERKRGAPKAADRLPFHLDRNCGCEDSPDNKICARNRNIDCKLHKVQLKRLVPGRSRPFDDLLAAFKENQCSDPGQGREESLANEEGAQESALSERKKGRPANGTGKMVKMEVMPTETLSAGPSGSASREGLGRTGDTQSVTSTGANTSTTNAKGRKRKQNPSADTVGQSVSGSVQSGGPVGHGRLDDPGRDREFMELIYGARMAHSKVLERARARVYALPPCDTAIMGNDGNGNGQEIGELDAAGDVEMDPVDDPPPDASKRSEIDNVFGFLAPKIRLPPPIPIGPEDRATIPAPTTSVGKDSKPSKKSWQPKKTPAYLSDKVQYKSFGGGAMLGSWHLQRREESAMEGLVIGLMEKVARQRRGTEFGAQRDG